MTNNVNEENDVQKLSDVLRMPDDQLGKIFNDRTVSIPVSALHALKQELIFSIGNDRTKGVFIRYGWHTGVSEGQKMRGTTGLPIFIEDEYHNVVVKSEDVTLNCDLKEMTAKTTRFFELGPEIGLLRTPIYFDNKIRGYCSFIYHGDSRPTPLEHMIIDQASLTASIVLLHDNIKIQTTQNIRRSFLTDILDEKLEEEELYKIATYLNLDPEGDYWVFTLEKVEDDDDLSLEIERNEKLLRHINLFFKQRGLDIFACYKAGKLIFALEERTDNTLLKDKPSMIADLLKHCRRKFKSYQFYVGVSSVQETIKSLPALYKETEIALNTKTDDKTVLYYDDLGVEKLLFQISDQSMLNRFVESQIGDLLAADKHDELTETLKYYIENGMSINATSKAMAMSISGLRYRLEKISDLLNMELDDTKALFSIYMALNVAAAKKK